MPLIDNIKPTTHQRIMDLVQSAGLAVSDWATKPLLIAAALTLACAATAQADWKLYFRNGNTLEVPSYKEQGGMVSYPRFGGTVSVPRAEILRIEATGEDAKLKVAPPPPPDPKAEEDADRQHRAALVEQIKRGEIWKNLKGSAANFPIVQAGPFLSRSECEDWRSNDLRRTGDCYFGTGGYFYPKRQPPE